MKRNLLLFSLLVSLQFVNAQQTCDTALPITAGIHLVNAVDGSQVPQPLCEDQYGQVPSEDNPAGKWYTYTPTGNFTVTVTSDIAANTPRRDTRFHVYSGNCSNLICVSGDDDNGSGLSSTASFDVAQGTIYYIAWDNRWTSNGFSFSLSEAPIVPNPCLTATPVTTGITTVASINGNNIITSCSNASAAKWYSYTANGNSNLTITSDLPQNICKDTKLSVYTGNCPGVFTCVTSDDNSGTIQCNNGNTNSFLSKKTFEVQSGVTYYIVWDNQWSSEGFDFQITEQAIVRPVNYNTQLVSTINSSYDTCIVDMNGDNLDDIVGVSGNNLKIHYQGANGNLSIVNFPITGTSKMPSWSIVAGDYNKDGFNDLVLGAGNGLSLWKSNTTGTEYTSVTPGEYIFCQRTNFVDLNNDGNLDIFSCHDIDPNVYYLNDGNAGLQYFQSGISPGAYMLGITEGGGNYASLWTDYDNDGDVDLFISKCSGPPSELHRNDGNGIFTDISAIAEIDVTPVQSWSSAVADFDNDGDMDIVIGSNGSTGHMFFRNDLDKTNNVEEPFANITLGSGLDLDPSDNRDYIAYDFDNDGLVDIMGGGNKILFNKGDNVFESVSYPQINVGAIGDLNNDGFLDILDIVVLNNQRFPYVRYAIPNENNWLKITTKGIASNSNGIGARIEIYGAWGKQIRDVRSGEGFEFGSTLNTHFGLGTATEIDQVVVKWPSGTVDTFENVAINQTLNVVEGATLSNQNFNNGVFAIYPNPVKETINIQLKDNTITLNNAQIFDINGKRVISTNNVDQPINVSQLANGSYILVVTDSDTKSYSQKFIKE
ncbi:CRTAC1 family protein [Flavobacterium dankookense]|uniref:Putative secreted protein (Por secretion system target) n=1 Tax=Flavobacterium dankookense TaxID=706186 RepID=A0A4R6QBV6_9FLAO|nr:CRTAC1 family protein [Flavobacterium dankookense]TDP59436.1 putative secreted protein (Por secretion system target) [Flavobacterium dankookense]